MSTTSRTKKGIPYQCSSIKECANSISTVSHIIPCHAISSRRVYDCRQSSVHADKDIYDMHLINVMIFVEMAGLICTSTSIWNIEYTTTALKA
mmetsp:Transcript_24301/g.37144  ORF Transcript_24301/g.37144 Transcript_24301/m.37144 type:complete len:93 (+) Transcript_24301:76-354(+)